METFVSLILLSGGAGHDSEVNPDQAQFAVLNVEAAVVQEATKSAKPKKRKQPKEGTVAPDEPQDPDQPGDTDDSGFRFVWKQHPSIRYGSKFRLDFQAKFQEDAHDSYSGAPGLFCANEALPTTCQWELHRNRIGILGHVFKRIEYEVERELTEQELTDRDVLAGYTTPTPWKDVYVNVSYVRNAQIQAGRFKIPFGLDQLTSITHNDFAYRSLGANYLAPARDTGVMVHGRFFKRGFNYWTGVFQHDGDNARSKKIAGGDGTFAARVTGTPFRKWNRDVLGRLEIGTAVAISKLSDDSFHANGLRGRTVLTQDTFYEPAFVNGYRHRWEADVDFTLGPGWARSEYTWVTDDRLRQGLANQDLPDARAQSWYVSGGWVLTGEPKRRPVRAVGELPGGGFGAVEAVARYERLWYDSVGAVATIPSNSRSENIFLSGDRAFTIGVNWTLNRWIKLQFNGIRERVENVQRSPVANGAPFWSRVLRFQFLL
jgi:phosphate-selective porin OprO/OprP